ncbi:hypothetical protein LXL04_020046 [Taraxacum kok-saghyz]
MAANLIPIQPPVVIRASTSTSTSTSGNQKSDLQCKSWWTPLFGWSSEPDYIHDSATIDKSRKNNTTFLAPILNPIWTIDWSGLVYLKENFTEEKARKLWMLTMETTSFHDAMYHFAIASRLASDFSDRCDQ